MPHSYCSWWYQAWYCEIKTAHESFTISAETMTQNQFVKKNDELTANNVANYRPTFEEKKKKFFDKKIWNEEKKLQEKNHIKRGKKLKTL